MMNVIISIATHKVRTGEEDTSYLDVFLPAQVTRTVDRVGATLQTHTQQAIEAARKMHEHTDGDLKMTFNLRIKAEEFD